MPLEKNMSKKAYLTTVGLKLAIAVFVAFMVAIVKYPPWAKFKKLRILGLNPDPYCLFDYAHHFTQTENLVIRHYPSIAKPMLLVSSMMIDYTFVNALIVWIMQCQSGRLLWSIIFFYLTRGLCQVLFANQAFFLFRFPIGGIWEVPYLPSLMVPYGLTSDFYFSGHCGFMILNFMEVIVQEKHRIKAIFQLLFIVYLMFVLMIFRAHYSIGKGCLSDIPIGIMTAFYIYFHVSNNSRQLDYLATRHIYFGILSRMLPCLKKTGKRSGIRIMAKKENQDADWKSAPLISNEH